MIAYVDSSVLLRKLFGEPRSLSEWATIEVAYSSRLLPLEVGRVIDQCRLAGQITDDEVAQLHEQAHELMLAIDILAITDAILERAASPMPTVLGSLDSIHLSTAIELRRTLEKPIRVATHDVKLARAARSSGLEVCGI